MGTAAIHRYVEKWGLSRWWHKAEQLVPRRPMIFVNFLNDHLQTFPARLGLAIADQAGQPAHSNQELIVYDATQQPPRVQQAESKEAAALTPQYCNALVLFGHGAPGHNKLSSTESDGLPGQMVFSFDDICQIVQKFQPRMLVLVTCSGSSVLPHSLMIDLLRRFPDLHVYGCTETLN